MMSDSLKEKEKKEEKITEKEWHFIQLLFILIKFFIVFSVHPNNRNWFSSTALALFYRSYHQLLTTPF